MNKTTIGIGDTVELVNVSIEELDTAVVVSIDDDGVATVTWVDTGETSHEYVDDLAVVAKATGSN